MDKSNDEFASKMTSSLFNTVVNMKERVGEIEARRLLSHLDYARIDDSVCDESVSTIAELIDNNWKKCDKSNVEIAMFITEENNIWAKQGFRIIIEGGTERKRRRVMNYCIYRAIMARFESYTHIAKVYDWPTILPVIGDFRHEDKHSTITGMQKIEVLGLTEIDLTQPREMGGIETLLTSVLRSRMLSNRPTIITLKKPSWICNTAASCEINDLVNTNHDEVEEMVVRIRLKEIK